MNDPIKDFVKKHRGEFDHLDAPVLKLEQLRQKLPGVPVIRKQKVSILHRRKWLVAASVLLMLVCAWFFIPQGNEDKSPAQLAGRKIKNTPKKMEGLGSPMVGSEPNLHSPVHLGSPLTDDITTNVIAKRKVKESESSMSAGNIKSAPAGQAQAIAKVSSSTNDQEESDDLIYANNKITVGKTGSDLYARLADSTSASSRLLAILEIERAKHLDEPLLERLAYTLNNDQNTNVRLAALNLMQKYSQESQVVFVLVNSLDKQDDPMVQLGLISFLGKMKNINIENKLELLASSPNTFAAVRDEAYSILLKQNKL